MADFNLTNQQIKDTYEQLAQIGTSSLLLDGTGSIVDNLTITASHATFAESATLPSGILSSSAQIADDISGSFTSTSASLAGDIATNASDISTLTGDTSSYAVKTSNTFTGNQTLSNPNGNQTISFGGTNPIVIKGSPDFITTFENGGIDLGQNELTGLSSVSGSVFKLSANGSNRFRIDSRQGNGVLELTSNDEIIVEMINDSDGSQYVDFKVPVTASNALISSDLAVSNNLTVNGTASFGYLQSVTGSAKIVGDAFIQLNTDTPSLRYAGLQVIDSGSTSNTSSFIWDSETNDWFYEYEGDATDHGIFLIGPEYGTKGTPTYNASNKLVKGTGGHHIVDSNITDDGTSVTVSTSLTASGFQGDLTGTASFATNALTASYALNVPVTASYALSASAADTFTISTELSLGSSTITVDSASATGSLIDNIHPAIASGSTAIKHIVTIDQTAYDTISGSDNVYDDTFYIISDAGDDVYPNNLQVDGQIYSPTFAGTIASSTSSIDFDNGNFATLNCASSTFLANPTNLQGGTTYTLIVTNGANISGYGTVWKFAGGTEPTLSANTDVITAVSDGTSLYAAALADFS